MRRKRGREKKEKEQVALWPLQQIFVISIRPNRLQQCLRRLGPLNQFVTIVPACNGETIDRQQWKGSIGNDNLRRGELGCFESHCRVWRYIVENNIQQALVLEDDASLYPTDARRISQAMADLPLGWDLLLLGRSRRQPDRHSVGPGLVVTGDFCGTQAYVITGSAALNLLLRPRIQIITEPVDDMLSQLGLANELLIVATVPEICRLIVTGSDTTLIY